MILQCPKCLRTKEGDFSPANPPGKCVCSRTVLWKVIKKLPEPGFVRVLNEHGWQELHGPDYREKKP